MPPQLTVAFAQIRKRDRARVGGKNASLGELMHVGKQKHFLVPDGFAVTAAAYRMFLRENDLRSNITKLLAGIRLDDLTTLRDNTRAIRQLVMRSPLPLPLGRALIDGYKKLGKRSGVTTPDVAVRSSATAEDLSDASFAGQQDTYLHIVGHQALCTAYKKCIASFFTARAVSYRTQRGINHMKEALAVGIQCMVRADRGVSGVLFTVDTESGFDNVVIVNASYGLGELIVGGRVVPDQFIVFKPLLDQPVDVFLEKKLGSKQKKLVYTSRGLKETTVSRAHRAQFCLRDEHIRELARVAVQVERHYGSPMDMEWAYDGKKEKLYFLQARPETVHSRKDVCTIERYVLRKKSRILSTGIAVGKKIASGNAHVIESSHDMHRFKKGEILVTRSTDPDWEPIMRLAAAIVTEQGGKTSHAAIVSRELGVPCVVGTHTARKDIKGGSKVTVACDKDEGVVYEGELPFDVVCESLGQLPQTKTKIMMNIADPDGAFHYAAYPHDGVGLCREEFIWTRSIQVHPLALVGYHTIPDAVLKRSIDRITLNAPDKVAWGADSLARGIAKIAATFYPHDVVVRLSDFKSNEYRGMVGGSLFEPMEENPMLGWRGASRYVHPAFREAFALECRALKYAREAMGFSNIVLMVPFCRTPEEGARVLDTMSEFGLERGKNGLRVYVMAEIPSNILLAREFAKLFDGFSIGSNDLTQLTLGLDRDSSLVAPLFDERNEAVKMLIRSLISEAHAEGRVVGICGQAPSDYPEFAQFLVEEGIDSLSLSPDSLVATKKFIADVERRRIKR